MDEPPAPRDPRDGGEDVDPAEPLEHRVADLSSADIQAAVTPLWTTKHKTAQKLLRHIGNVMQWAITQGLRTDDPVPAVARTLPKMKAAPNHYRALTPR